MNELPVARRPHHCSPSLESLRVVLAVKNFANIPGVCHIGLGVTATNTMRVLRRAGVQTEAWPAQTADELKALLATDAAKQPARPVTHVIVSAPSWVQPTDFEALCHTYPETEFVQLNHSGTAYLSIDKYGVKNIRAALELQLSLHNLRVGFNNPRGEKWAEGAFGEPVVLLPNLYDTTTFRHPVRNRRDHDPLRIGSFGAGRPWKNQLSAAEAAVLLARRLGVNLELYVNTMRPDGGERMIESRRELFDHLPGCKIVEVPWTLWPNFRRVISTMDVLMSPSFDETFNVVTADGIAEGVPSVVTGAIEWTPHSWWCEPWDPASLARVATHLLHDRPGAIHDARELLTRFVKDGTRRWIDYLTRRNGL